MAIKHERNIVIVCAAAFEAAPLLEALIGRDMKVGLLELGVGPIAAAKRMIESQARLRGAHIIFVGTCGIFGEFQGVHLVQPRRILWLPLGSRLEAGYLVEGTTEPYTFVGSRHAELSKIPKCDVICGPEISLNNQLTPGLQVGKTVENLELYSVFSEMEAVAEELTILLAVTNSVGTKAHQQWQTNHKQAAEMTAETLIQHLFS